jgi:hypothetical protein
LVGSAVGKAGLVRRRELPFQVVAVLGTPEAGGEAGSGEASSLLPPGQGMVEPDVSADPSLGGARVVKDRESQAGPPFRVISRPETSEVEASSVVVSPPSEPFLYLSPDNSSLVTPSLG